MRGIPTLAVLICATAAAANAAEDGRFRRYELPDFDALEMTLPPGWQDAVVVQPGSGELIIELRPQAGAGFEAFVTPSANGQAPGRILDAQSLREAVREAALRLRPRPAAAPEIRRLQGTDGVGFYFVATDSSPPPDEYGHLAQGLLLAGSLVLRFEILTHDPADPAIALALAMLQGAVHRDRGRDRP